MELIIVSGTSGAGKSVVLKILEDQGFYCVDNLTIKLIPLLIEEFTTNNQYSKIAISLDVRNLTYNDDNIIYLEECIKKINELIINYKIIFLDCDLKTIIRRYSDTRRKHPLMINNNLTLEKSIQKEKDLLVNIKDLKNVVVVDTSNISVHQLAIEVKLKLNNKNDNFSLIFNSFGFKNGIPLSADFVFDARFLPNPYWYHELREFNGLDEKIINFFQQQPLVEEYLKSLTKYLDFCLSNIKSSNRSFLTICIGCTGGVHRSVYLIERLSEIYKDKGYQTVNYHLTLDK